MEHDQKFFTIFEKSQISEPALFSPRDTTKQIDNFPEICVSTFSENIILKFSSLRDTKKIAELYTANGVIPVYKIRYKDTDIAFYHLPVSSDSKKLLPWVPKTLFCSVPVEYWMMTALKTNSLSPSLLSAMKAPVIII